MVVVISKVPLYTQVYEKIQSFQAYISIYIYVCMYILHTHICMNIYENISPYHVARVLTD